MTLRTGSKKGFTLIELMITVAIFSLCTLLVQGGLLRSANFLGHYAHTLAARLWVEERLWQVRQQTFYSEEGGDEAVSGSGSFTESQKDFEWTVNPSIISSGKDLYEVDLRVAWLEGNRPTQLHTKVYEAK